MSSGQRTARSTPYPSDRKLAPSAKGKRAKENGGRVNLAAAVLKRKRDHGADGEVAKADRAAVPCHSTIGGFLCPFPLRYFSISLSSMYFISVLHDSILKSATGLESNPFLSCTQRERNGFTHQGGYLPQRLEAGEYNKCKVFRLRSPLLND
jgi:hypothetical protein